MYVEGGDEGYKVVCPYWIDTDAYTDRDRLMFACGAEFEIILQWVRFNRGKLRRIIHRENETRVKLLCGHFKRKCKIRVCSEKDDPQGLWSNLTIYVGRLE